MEVGVVAKNILSYNYYKMIKVIISSIIIVVALFVGFYPHENECKLLAMLGVSICPGKWIHVVLGTALYALAVFITQIC